MIQTQLVINCHKYRLSVCTLFIIDGVKVKILNASIICSIVSCTPLYCCTQFWLQKIYIVWQKTMSPDLMAYVVLLWDVSCNYYLWLLSRITLQVLDRGKCVRNGNSLEATYYYSDSSLRRKYFVNEHEDSR